MKDLCVTGGLSRAQVNYSYSLRLFGDLPCDLHVRRPILRFGPSAPQEETYGYTKALTYVSYRTVGVLSPVYRRYSHALYCLKLDVYTRTSSSTTTRGSIRLYCKAAPRVRVRFSDLGARRGPKTVGAQRP